MANLAQWHRRVIESHELWTLPLRAGLSAMEFGYMTAIRARNWHYDRRGPEVTLDKPVISVGNISVGGTGKTPVVIDIIQRLIAMGKRPAVLARGYGASHQGPNDEEMLIRERVPGVLYASHHDRSMGARLIAESRPDVYVLDDGFQHRRVARHVDIVLLDCTCPFGFGRLLPRGLLREPIESLSRAHVVVLTRCDQVQPGVVKEIEQRVRGVTDSVTILRCRHSVTSFEMLDGSKLDDGLRGKRVILVAGIGNPAAFRQTIEAMGLQIVGELIFPDHHSYREIDTRQIHMLLDKMPESLVVTTEKDAVKLRDMVHSIGNRVACVKVAIEFEGDGSRIMDMQLNGCLT